jgi:hypothetical protein
LQKKSLTKWFIKLSFVKGLFEKYISKTIL